MGNLFSNNTSKKTSNKTSKIILDDVFIPHQLNPTIKKSTIKKSTIKKSTIKKSTIKKSTSVTDFNNAVTNWNKNDSAVLGINNFAPYKRHKLVYKNGIPINMIQMSYDEYIKYFDKILKNYHSFSTCTTPYGKYRDDTEIPGVILSNGTRITKIRYY